MGSIQRLLEKTWDEDGIFEGKILHGRREFDLPGINGKGVAYAGSKDNIDDFDISPYKFYEFYLGRALIAKALVSYCNCQMGEVDPTIEIMEVRKEHRGKGIGGSLVSLIEKEAADEGFGLIWATDCREEPSFWEHIGYEGDGEEMAKGIGIWAKE